MEPPLQGCPAHGMISLKEVRGAAAARMDVPLLYYDILAINQVSAKAGK